MLDYSKLKAPAADGQVLVAPAPGALVRAARANHEALRNTDARLLDMSLAMCRRQTREAIVGSDDALVFVTGHDPALVHPGVWAKHIVAMRLAAATGGRTVNLVVDSNAPQRSTVAIPSVSEGRVSVRLVRFAHIDSGFAYEQIARQTGEEITRFEHEVQDAMGGRYEDSQMPRFFGGIYSAADARDWVDQVVAARRAVENHFGVVIEDRRVGEVWVGPLLLDMLVHAERFAGGYNRALGAYRRQHRVRGAQRPIPDLDCGGERCEVAMWVYRAQEPRRRLFAACTDGLLRLFAGDEHIGTVPLPDLQSCDGLETLLTELSGWRLRPRALILTLWARLLLADLFIHGIGGAKYDRITDAIVRDYYGMAPPEIACVSATLQMELPRRPATSESLRGLRHALRDLQCNPQRNLPADPDLEPLIQQRTEMVHRGIALAKRDRRNRAGRRAVFGGIRRINSAMLALHSDTIEVRRTALAQAVLELRQNRVAEGREYFFGLYDRPRLERLLQALPSERGFGV
jgi:hypothetical protein